MHFSRLLADVLRALNDNTNIHISYGFVHETLLMMVILAFEKQAVKHQQFVYDIM